MSLVHSRLSTRKHPPSPICDTCGAKASGPRPPIKGSGWFFLCETCDRTWKLDRTPDRLPCRDVRKLVLAKLKADGFDPEEAIEMVSEYGLIPCAELLGIPLSGAA